MNRGKRQGAFRRRRGVVLAEAALVMMLLCLVTLGALQYGWFFYCLHGVTNAARQGARVEAALDGAGLGNGALDAALNAALPADLSAAAAKGVTVAGNVVTGQVSIPAGSVALLPITFLPVPECRAAVTMAKEGAAAGPS